MTATVAAATQIRRRRRVSFLPLDTAKVWYTDGAVLQKRSSYSPTVMMASRRFDAVEQGALIKRRSSKPKSDKAPERFRATAHSLERGKAAPVYEAPCQALLRRLGAAPDLREKRSELA